MNKADVFLNLFKGRSDVFTTKWFNKKEGKVGFSPVCKLRGLSDKCNYRCRECSHPDYIPYDSSAITNHLKGKVVAGVFPLLPNNSAFFAAVDFDDHVDKKAGQDGQPKGKKDPLADARLFIEACEVQELTCYLEISQSGQGYHVWMFFKHSIKSWKIRAVIFAILQEAGIFEKSADIKSFDRLFPNQDKLSGKGFGNLIALPLQGPEKVKEGLSCFIDPISEVPFSNQFDFFGKVKRVDEKQIDDLIKDWELKEPVCAAKNYSEEGAKGDYQPRIAVYKGIEKLEACCKFVRFCKDCPDKVREPLWFSLATILVPFERGREKYHELSRLYKKYSEKQTDAKFENAIKSVADKVAPHTCATIQSEGFADCPKGGCGGTSPVAVAFAGKKRYWVERNGYYMFKSIAKIQLKYQLSNFVINIKEDNIYDDGFDKTRIFIGQILVGNKVADFEISAKDFFNDTKLKEVIGCCIGTKAIMMPSDIAHVRIACQEISKIKENSIMRQFGWNSKHTEFITPSTRINASGMYDNVQTPVKQDVSQPVSALDICALGSHMFKETANHICTTLLGMAPDNVILPLMGHTFLPPLISFLDDTTKYVLWLTGITGSGKSFLSRLLQCFYGDFRKDTSIASWTSTMNFLQVTGFYFKDSLFLVDDFKKGNIRNTSELVQKLQTYADGTGRGRLNSDSTTKNTKPIRGLMLTTGEDVPDNEASIIARTLLVDMANSKKNLAGGSEALSFRVYYSGVMGRYMQWLCTQKLETNAQKFMTANMQTFYQGIEGKQNDVRIARNLSLNYMGFVMFATFMNQMGIMTKNAAQVKCALSMEVLLKLRDNQISSVVREQGSNVFMDTLKDLVSANRVALYYEDSQKPLGSGYIDVEMEEVKNLIGFIKKDSPQYVYINPTLAYAEVVKTVTQSGGFFKLSKNAVCKQLIADGVIQTSLGGKSAQFVWFSGRSHRVWVLNKSSLGLQQIG